MSEIDSDDHVLRAVGRALGGAALTEVGTCAAVLALVLALGGAFDAAGVGIVLLHAAGVSLGAGVALLVVDATARRWWAGWWGAVALTVGFVLAPLAPLGGIYVLEVFETFDVAASTQVVLSTIVNARLGEVIWLAGFALLGYAPVLIARWCGARVVDQIVVGAVSLSGLGLAGLARGTEQLFALPTAGYAALLLTRAVALPVGLELGDRLGARALRRLRGDDPVPRKRSLPLSLSLARAGLLLPLVGVVAALVGQCPFEPPSLTKERLGARDDEERVAIASRLASNGVVQDQTATPTRAPVRSASMTQVEVALRAVTRSPLLPLRDSAVACLREAAERDDVDALIVLATMLHEGTELHVYEYEDYRGFMTQFWVWVSDSAQQAAALDLARRAVASPHAPSSSPMPAFELTPGPIIEALEQESLPQAHRFARLVAARHSVGRGVLVDLLRRRCALRTPADDAWLTPHPAWLRRTRATEAWLGEILPVVPTSVVSTNAPIADALARAALAHWPHDRDVARALAIGALAWREDHPEACVLLAAWHLHEACRGREFLVSFGHIEVAESYLAPVERRAPDDVAVLANGGLCDVVRALLDPELDRGWAERALVRVVAAVRLDPASAPAATVRDQVVAALRQRTAIETPSEADALATIAAAEDRLAILAAANREGATARLHAASAARLRARVGR